VKDNTFKILKSIAKENLKKIFLTFSLVIVENALLLVYPIIAGFAINKILEGETLLALSYAFLVLVVWMVGSLRRKIDTQVFAKIYANLVIKVVLNERSMQKSSSATAAHVALSREFINFFEEDFPIFFTSVVSIFGACLMLLIIEFYVGLICILALLFFVCNIKKFSQINDGLYNRLNNRIEKDVDIISNSGKYTLKRHYELTSMLRISISNKEAFGYFVLELSAFFVFGTAIFILSNSPHDAGHIYAVITYLWTFAMSLDDAPRLIQQYSQLKDIGMRVNAELSDTLG